MPCLISCVQPLPSILYVSLPFAEVPVHEPAGREGNVTPEGQAAGVEGSIHAAGSRPVECLGLDRRSWSRQCRQGLLSGGIPPAWRVGGQPRIQYSNCEVYTGLIGLALG